MNRENKRKQYEKGYYKTHACSNTFTCKVCGRPVFPQGAGSDHRNHCPNCLASLHVDEEPGDRASDCGGIMAVSYTHLLADSESRLLQNELVRRFFRQKSPYIS